MIASDYSLSLVSASPTTRSLGSAALWSDPDVLRTIAERDRGGLCLWLLGHSCCIC